jgi:hypothetical protein
MRIMSNFLLILKFFTGLTLLLGFGRLMGHILKLDEYLKYPPDKEPEHLT